MASTHLSTIASMAQLRAPAVYHYYSSREELIAAVMREGQRMVRERVLSALEALPEGASIEGQVDAAVAAHLRVELEESAFARAVVRNADRLSDSARATFEAESREFHDIWRDLMSEAEAVGALRSPLTPDIARLLVIGALNGCTAWWHEGIPVETVVRTAQAMIRAGLFTEAGHPDT